MLYIHINMNLTWEEFYAKHPPPQDFAQSEALLKAFTERQLEKNNKVVLVTVSVYLTEYCHCIKIIYMGLIEWWHNNTFRTQYGKIC